MPEGNLPGTGASSGGPIRVLIVDDSAVVRQTLSEILASDPQLEVIGTAADPYLGGREDPPTKSPTSSPSTSRCRGWTA